jgi:hypothetical protein
MRAALVRLVGDGSPTSDERGFAVTPVSAD